jgi:hypothetical protein
MSLWDFKLSLSSWKTLIGVLLLGLGLSYWKQVLVDFTTLTVVVKGVYIIICIAYYYYVQYRQTRPFNEF